MICEQISLTISGSSNRQVIVREEIIRDAFPVIHNCTGDETEATIFIEGEGVKNRIKPAPELLQ